MESHNGWTGPDGSQFWPCDVANTTGWLHSMLQAFITARRSGDTGFIISSNLRRSIVCDDDPLDRKYMQQSSCQCLPNFNDATKGRGHTEPMGRIK